MPTAWTDHDVRSPAVADLVNRAGEAIRSQPGAVRRAQHVVALAALLPPNGN
jgi:hypothetical protein